MALNDPCSVQECIQSVLRLAGDLAEKGWLPATSGNLSVKVRQEPLVMAITRSGADKQRLRTEDVLLVDDQHRVLENSPYRPSAETIVHTKLYKAVDCGCVLHVHTVYNNIASEVYFAQGAVRLANHELLKALDHWELGAEIDVPIVENFHDLNELGEAVEKAVKPGVPAVLVRNHGIYVWGATDSAAMRYLEALEFLFQYVIILSSLHRR